MRRALWFTAVRLGFRLLYYEMAWTYDLVSWLVSLGEWRSWQRAALPFIYGRQVLELGHGPGHMLLALQNQNVAVIGLDLSPAMGRLARKRTQRTRPLVRGRVQDLPFGTAVFSTVLATFPTDYILDPQTLAVIHRVLQADGRLVIVPEGHLHGQGLVVRFIAWLYAITGQGPTPFTGDDGHVQVPARLWDPFRTRFADAGFNLAIEPVRLRRSSTTVLIATKAAPPA